MKTIFAENGGYDIYRGRYQGEFELSKTSLTQRGVYYGPRKVSLKRLGKALRSKAKIYFNTIPVSHYGKVMYTVFVIPKKTVLYIGCVKFKGTAARELRQAALKASR